MIPAGVLIFGVIWLSLSWFVVSKTLMGRRLCQVSSKMVAEGTMRPEFLPFARSDFLELPNIVVLVLRSVTVGPLFLTLAVVGLIACATAAAVVPKRYLNSAVRVISAYICWACGLRVVEKGTRAPLSEAPCIVANHNSAFDILILLVKKCCFVSMDGVRLLPLIGKVAAAIGCIFVVRECKDSRASAKDAITSRLSSQMSATCDVTTSLVVFAEGSTNNGHYLLQFRRGAFEANVPVQPLRIEFADYHINFTVISLSELVCFACTLPSREITLHWLPVITPRPGSTPEQLADQARTAIAKVPSAYGHPAMTLCDMSISHRNAIQAADYLRDVVTRTSTKSD